MLVSMMNNGKRSLEFPTGEGPLTKKVRLSGLDHLSPRKTSASNGGLLSVEKEYIVRRLANVKAQVALASFYSISESPSKSRESYLFSDDKGELLVCGDMEGVSASLHDYTAKGNAQSSVMAGNSGGGRQLNGRHKPRISLPSELPESPLSSALSEEESSFPSQTPPSMLQDGRVPCGDTECVRSNPALSGVVNQSDTIEKRTSNERQFSSPLSPSVMDYETGYVKRLASLNARACVTALIEPERKLSSKCNRNHTHNDNSKRGSTASRVPQSASPAPSEVKRSTPDVELRPFSVGIVKCKSPQLQDASSGDLEGLPFNTLGLLGNGDTIHPHYSFYLDSHSAVPHRITPVVVPSTMEGVWQAVQRAKEQFKKAKRRLRSTKGNNGWSTLGEAIKSIEYTQDGAVHKRKYFAGIRRKNEEIFVRDCVTIRSGVKKNDRPYVAKIASIWQEPGGYLMLKLFWYYRPADIVAASLPGQDPESSELFASQHHDDNSVACIEDKCYVLGLRSYCRYQSSMCGHRSSMIPELQSLVKFNSNCEVVVAECPPLDTAPELVYLCYQGYNHLSGKIARQ